MSRQNCLKRLKNRIFSFIFIVSFLTLTIGFLLSDITYAQTSDKINLQGKIVRNDTGFEGLNVTDGSPACVNSGLDTCDFQVKYYDASSAGNLLYTETFSDTEIGDYGGVFNLSLGSVLGSGTYSNLSDLISNEDTIYLQIEFAPGGGGSFTEVFTRTQLNASAYAIRSKYAEGSVNDSFRFYSASSSTGITGTTGSVYYDTTDGALKVHNGSGWQAIGENLWTDGGTFSFLTSTTDDLVLGGSTPGTSKFFFDVSAGRLGIGTDTPTSTIDIAGASSAISNDTGDITITPAGNLIVSQGNVGIGTVSPSQKLDLIGSMELEYTTSSTTGVIYKGSSSFIHNFQHPVGGGAIPAGHNTFVGEGAGNFTMGSTATSTYHSSYNTGIGYQVLVSNTIGANNVAVGDMALYFNTSGSSNVAVGNRALYDNTTGLSNIAIGRNALRFNTIGGENFAAGTNALYSNVSGEYNFAVGTNAGRYLADGVTANETSTHSIFFGYDTRALAAGQTNQIVIGNEAIGLGSNTVVLGNANIITTALRGNVGIGNTAPGYKLDVAGDINTSTGTFRMAGIDYGQYFIDSSGVSGQIWSSDGTGRGTWIDPSTIDTDTNDYVDSVTFSTTTGDLTLGRTGSLPDLTGSIDGRYLRLTENDTVTGRPAFNGGVSGTSSPFTVDSNTVVTNLNADLLDGHDSSYYMDNTDSKVAVDAAATPDYLGASGTTGVIRIDSSGLTYSDGGNFITLGLEWDMNQHVTTTSNVTFASVNTGSGQMYLGDAVITNGDINSIPTNDQVYDFVTGQGYSTGDDWGSQVVQTNTTLTGDGTTTTVLGINLANANTWTGEQTFSADTHFPGNGIWNTSGNVGIGTSTPAAKLDIAGANSIISNSSGDITISPASGLLVLNATLQAGTNNTYDVGTSSNRWKDVYTQGTIQVGINGDSGSIRYNTTNDQLEFSNDGTNWIPLGDIVKTTTLSAEYAGAVMSADGSNNIGFMTSDAEGTASNSMNYYEWNSSETTLQDYDVRVRFTLPSDFASWGTNAFTFSLATEANASTNNKVDFYVYEESTGTVDGSSTAQYSATAGVWKTTSIAGTALTDCNAPGETCLVIMRMYSANDNYVRIGDIDINYNREL